jgi:NADH:ubiquinone oxidoreductase subunit 5 (subunit L)/multisubunit Na+/H+ antiporter MnhA subunit
MFRVVILTFLGEHKDKSRGDAIHESPAVITIPLVVFAVFSFFIFYSFNPIDASSGWFAQAVQRPESVVPMAVAPANTEIFEGAMQHAHVPAMLLSLTVAGLGILAAFAMYYWKKISADELAFRLKPLHTFLLNKWYFDELYDATIIRGTLALAAAYRWFDSYIIDGIVNGIAKWTVGLTNGVQRTWDDNKFGAAFYVIVFALLSLLIGWKITEVLLPVNAGLAKILELGLVGLGVSGFSFFLFYAGIGGFDNKIIDGIVNLVAYLAGFFGLVMRKLQTGKVQTYLVFVLFGVMVFFLWFR